MIKTLENFKNQMLTKEQMKNVKGGDWVRTCNSEGHPTSVYVWQRGSDGATFVRNANNQFVQVTANLC